MTETPETIDGEEEHGSGVPQGLGRLLGRLGRFSWSLHNLIGHPLMELLYLVGLNSAAHWAHDLTIPRSVEGAKDRYDDDE